MLELDTHDFDIVLQVSQAEFDRQLALMFASGRLEGQSHGSINQQGVRGSWNFLFDTPWTTFEGGPDHEIILHFPFNDSYLEITEPSETYPEDEWSDIDGVIEVRQPVEVIEREDVRLVVLDFEDGAQNIDVQLSPGGVPPRIENILEIQIEASTDRMLQQMGQLSLLGESEDGEPNGIPVRAEADDPQPLVPVDVDAGIIETGISPSRNALGIYLLGDQWQLLGANGCGKLRRHYARSALTRHGSRTNRSVS